MANINYGEILKKSWTITWKNKWLWLYGLIVGSSAGSAGFRYSSDFSKFFKNFQDKNLQEIPEKAQAVLGTQTTIFTQWLSQIPGFIWLILGLSFLSIIIVYSLINWILQSWATAGLITGINLAQNNKPATLKSTSPPALSKIKPLILLTLIYMLISLGLLLLPALIVGIIFAVLSFIPVVNFIWLFIGGLACLVTWIGGFILLGISSIFAQRLIILQNFSPEKAFKTGWQMARKHFFPSAIMGLINSTLGCVVSCLSTIVILALLGIPIGIGIVSLIIGKGFSPLVIPVVLVILLFMMVIIYIFSLVNAIFTVFKTSNWNLFFTQIISEELSK